MMGIARRPPARLRGTAMATGFIEIASLAAAALACCLVGGYLVYRKLMRLALSAGLLLMVYVAAFYIVTASAPVPGSSPPMVQRSFPSALAMTIFLPCLLIDRGLCAASGATVAWVARPGA
jgi:hypothetical protein